LQCLQFLLCELNLFSFVVDPNNVQLSQDQNRHKSASASKIVNPIEIADAVVNAICRRCGGKGHMVCMTWNPNVSATRI